MWLYSAKWFYSSEMVVVGKSGGNRAKVVLFGFKKLYSGKSGCIRASVVVFGKVVVFGQSGRNLAKVDVFWQK